MVQNIEPNTPTNHQRDKSQASADEDNDPKSPIVKQFQGWAAHSMINSCSSIIAKLLYSYVG